MIALALAALLAGQVPSPPTEWTRADLDGLFGPPAMVGPLGPPWAPGSTVATWSNAPDDLSGPCRAKLALAPAARWLMLAYFTPAAQLVSTHCLQLGDLDVGHDVLPDVTRRLKGGRS